jgi:hypothetical protein
MSTSRLLSLFGLLAAWTQLVGAYSDGSLAWTLTTTIDGPSVNSYFGSSISYMNNMTVVGATNVNSSSGTNVDCFSIRILKASDV